MTVWPNGSRTKPTSTSGWGWYDPYNTGELVFHYGDDEVGFDWNHAPETGVIVYAQFNGAAGNDIRLQSDRDGTIFRMLHNASLDGVWVGRRYNEGDAIAPQGNTSTELIGGHTHLEVWPGGNINNRVDPVPWMNARIGSSSAGGGSTPFPILTIPEGAENMSEPIYARGDKADVWYALYLTAEQAGDSKIKGSGAVYSGRRSVTKGERAIIEKLGKFPHPKQDVLVIISQADFDGINKLYGSA